MQTVYTVHVEIDTTFAFVVRRTFMFATQDERNDFMASPPDNVTVKGYGVDHILNSDEARKECKRQSEIS